VCRHVGRQRFSDFGADQSRFSTFGTSVYNAATSSVVLTFPIATINAAGPDPFTIGTQTYLGKTVTAGVVLNRQFVDAVSPSPTSYIRAGQ